MESRVLSPATTITTTVSGLRRSPRESHHQNVSFVSLKPIGTVGEGGNVIWGRQLRPALLLESFHAPAGLFSGKREILRPTLAAASSPAEGSDSSGWGPSPPFWLGQLALADSGLISLFFSLTRWLLQRREGCSRRILRQVPGSRHRLLLLHVVRHQLTHVTLNNV